jgi:exodeoxyribonuclease VII large subunit
MRSHHSPIISQHRNSIMTEIDILSVGPDCDSMLESNVPPIPSLTLRAFLEEAGRAIRQTLPPEAWVEAVVLDVRQKRNGLSLELVEPNVESTANSACLRAFVGISAIAAIENNIGLTLDCDVLKGAHARLRIKPTFHMHYHLQGNVTGLDPAMADSLIAKRIQSIRRQLADEGILRAQSSLPPPPDITQIAVIHPERSAGWADLHGELRRLEDLGLLEVLSLPATFEGPNAAATLQHSLASAAMRAQQGTLDLVLIVRGGGAAAGLATLTNLNIARAICKMPVPVVTGIGHASDHSLLDEVAWRAADTPSKALGLLKALLRQSAEGAIASHRTIVNSLDRMLEQTLRPQLSADRAAVLHTFQRITAEGNESLRDLWFAVQQHLLCFRSDLDHIDHDLRREASGLLSMACGLPPRIGHEADDAYGAVVAGSQSRWRAFAANGPGLQPSLDVAETFLTRQANELARLLTHLEIAARRKLSAEFDRLTQMSGAIDAIGIDSTLARGFTLPLDKDRRIIRTADALQSLASFELLFRDGSVACRPA